MALRPTAVRACRSGVVCSRAATFCLAAASTASVCCLAALAPPASTVCAPGLERFGREAPLF